MKLVFTTACLISSIFASLDHMENDFKVLMQAYGTDRAFTGLIADSIKANIEGYGCWCYFDDDHGLGKSQPVDAVDGLCKTLSEGYECAMRDAETEGTSCIPWEVGYVSIVGSNIDLDLTSIQRCENVNPGNNCAARACSVESNFLENTFAEIFNHQSNDDANKHENGFDVSTECVTKKGSGPSAKSCCGVYPSRFPFKTLDGDRGCCGTRTFSTLTLNCCDAEAGTVKFNC